MKRLSNLNYGQYFVFMNDNNAKTKIFASLWLLEISHIPGVHLVFLVFHGAKPNVIADKGAILKFVAYQRSHESLGWSHVTGGGNQSGIFLNRTGFLDRGNRST